jgi:hypothetical protein
VAFVVVVPIGDGHVVVGRRRHLCLLVTVHRAAPQRRSTCTRGASVVAISAALADAVDVCAAPRLADLHVSASRRRRVDLGAAKCRTARLLQRTHVDIGATTLRHHLGLLVRELRRLTVVGRIGAVCRRSGSESRLCGSDGGGAAQRQRDVAFVDKTKPVLLDAQENSDIATNDANRAIVERKDLIDNQRQSGEIGDETTRASQQAVGAEIGIGRHYNEEMRLKNSDKIVGSGATGERLIGVG